MTFTEAFVVSDDVNVINQQQAAISSFDFLIDSLGEIRWFIFIESD